MAEADRDRKPLSDQDSRAPLPLAQVEDLEELKARYEVYSDDVLLRWAAAVKGSHREAITALLRDRGAI